MEEKEYTKFRLNLQQFSVELAGEKTFVEELYRKVYRDLLPLLSTPEPTPKEIDPAPAEPASYARLDYTWVYKCTPHYNKVYVIENGVVTHSVFGRYVDPRRLRRIYLDHTKPPLFSELSSGNRTLWAEITPEGRRMIEEAAQRRDE
ncbi:MAG: hypothetical protein AUK47_05750 [Deltaproteobacteria bacterium CG2_30_63_29]|nr:MAG: hypothetical protein AUK47_05750 [Deltaproteobacteria bacterium CG2_30_63_29]PIW01546.1 MAG: hypothetical protein COW42_04575 [Deltaproteobacteria bacterium CG17_big_fil_post_rev_8_21_14_2_50_63_7]PJB42172.1 MAG: hypothetical protein CO108_12130 [Deltaproteobacteria bacterium CG_4_9_14_3_um_filter_63_12]